MVRSQRRYDTDVCNEVLIKILTNNPFRHSTYLFATIIPCKKRLKATVKLPLLSLHLLRGSFPPSAGEAIYSHKMLITTSLRGKTPYFGHISDEGVYHRK